MANFTNEDLAFTGYSQTVDVSTSLKFNDIQQRLYIDKTEEFEVVHFCNQFLEKYKVPQTRISFQKVESLLQNSNLENEVYREGLLDWIASNWVKI
ncbi:hypothetical protein H4V97_001067 [Flavobacterium sp. CG_23.5]|jgi:hypothetical protein|uniref:hypothetical protein n=1 Tax=unclassified Flavobacterium TaxID=196869 RepID=UPI0018C8DBD9|nr:MULTISPECIES: hypothetical protein [unclassified Flavobacterium]MBG6112045.1 hypothetical protein [Flavobacterium sp. CG_9.10]MBP2282749.1 hypothetical protein [Flavobacterium sp. CG_23.5]